MWLGLGGLNVLSGGGGGGGGGEEEEERCDWGLVSYGSSPQALPRGHSPPVMSIHKVSTCHLRNKDQEHLEFTKTFGGCLSPDKNLCKKKKLIFFTVWWDLCTPNLDRDRYLCKKKKLISYTVWWDFAVPILTVTEICAKRKSWYFLHCVVRFCSSNLDHDRNLCKKKKKLIFFTLCGEILHSKCWPWQKSVQKEKILCYSMWCDFCTPNLDRDRNLCKQKKLISYTAWWDFAVPILTVTEICANRKSWSLTLRGEILQFQSWPSTCGLPQLPAACLNTDDSSLWNR